MSKKEYTTVWALVITRTVLGGFLLLFGLNHFHGLLGETSFTAEANQFLVALQDTGYLFYLIKVVEFTGGLLLVGGFFVPMANLLLFPILLNILLFHIYLNPQGIWIPIVMILCSGVIFWHYRILFLFLFRFNLKLDPNSPRKGEVIPKFDADEIHSESIQNLRT
jgi:putative oxidoreductase